MNITAMLDKMTDDFDTNIKIIEEEFGTLEYLDEFGSCILHVLVTEHYDEKKCFAAICSLIEKGIDPNKLDSLKQNFIQASIYDGYTNNFIVRCIL